CVLFLIDLDAVTHLPDASLSFTPWLN
ncbi:hypothetical protein Tco_0787412, partial [Tanacetum coccineum]